MSPVILLTLAIAPGIFWLWFFYRRDSLEPEPRWLLLRTFWLGVLIAIPIALLQLPLATVVPSVLLFTLIAPLTEELGKYLMVRWTVYRQHDFDQPIDGMVYAAAIALGFATIENIGYLLSASQSTIILFGTTFSTTQTVLGTAIFRAVLSVPGHALWSSLWGYGLGLAKFAPPQRARRLRQTGLLLAILSHASFNGLLVAAPPAALGFLILLPLAWRMTLRRFAVALALSPSAKEKD